MAFEIEDNSGSLWVNERKTSERHPDRTGTVMVDGKLYFLNGWLKKTKDGKAYLNLTFKEKESSSASAGGGSIKRDMERVAVMNRVRRAKPEPEKHGAQVAFLPPGPHLAG
jgi:hypothetical protein